MNLSVIWCLPWSVWELQAPTNWILSRVTHDLSDDLKNPFCSVNWCKNEITFCVPYLSVSDKLISSQNTINIYLGALVWEALLRFRLFSYTLNVDQMILK